MKQSKVIMKLKMLLTLFKSKKSFVETLNYLETDFKNKNVTMAKIFNLSSQFTLKKN